MRKQLTTRILYPLHEAAKGQRTVAAYRAMMERETWPADRLRSAEFENLQRIFARAYEKSPFYRRSFDEAGVSPAALRRPEDLLKFPFTAKTDMRESREQMLTSREGLIPAATGGSTGDPTIFYSDRNIAANGWAACWRARSWWGIEFGDPWFWVWASPRDISMESPLKYRMKRLRDRLLNREVLSAFNMSQDAMARYAEKIRRSRGAYLYGYSSSLHVLAEYVLAHGIDLSAACIKTAITTSDMLYPFMRETIAKAFHCGVSTEYGSREGSFIAHQCPEGSLHVHSDRVWVEILCGGRPAQPGEPGEIVISVLDALAMPLLRYRTGDIGSWSADSCACGRPFPCLATLEGRSDDLLIGRGGRFVHSQTIIYYLRSTENIERFRILQDDFDRLRIQVVLADPAASVPLPGIQRSISDVFGYPVNVTLERVPELPPLKSGKHQSVVSTISRAHFTGMVSV
jgi:phenylacetate-CoA ligase